MVLYVELFHKCSLTHVTVFAYVWHIMKKFPEKFAGVFQRNEVMLSLLIIMVALDELNQLSGFSVQ